MAYLVPIVVVAILIWLFVTSKTEDNIKKNGVVTEAVVSRVKERSHIDNDRKSITYGEREYSYTYYVQYQDQNGKTIETKLRTLLSNSDLRLCKGDKIRIKYLPKKPKHVIPAK